MWGYCIFVLHMAVRLDQQGIAKEQISTFIDLGWIKGLHCGIFQ
jgi:hypothetical protein